VETSTESSGRFMNQRAFLPDCSLTCFQMD